MKFLDKIALNRLIKIISDFMIKIIEIFAPRIEPSKDTPQRKRPILDWLKNKRGKKDE